MKINVAKSAGFCFGVRRAMNIALRTVRTSDNIEMLGDIVHNETVVKEIKKAGIKKISALRAGDNKTLLIRAHGASQRTCRRAEKLGYRIVDATCPMVKEIHKIVKTNEREGYRIIIIGDKKHDEVLGIIGQLSGKAIVIDPAQQIPRRALRRVKKGTVVVQSTQNLDKVLRIVEQVKTLVPDLKFHNTVCKPTRIKQKEIKKLPLENDVVIVIGSKSSANTKRLYQIAKSANPRTFWVQKAKDLKKEMFTNAKSAGITAGASTPDQITAEIIDKITALTKTRRRPPSSRKSNPRRSSNSR
ncbi:MAG: 4-hydroxy-3-methylbut-2-enyl diphosphate reductase [Candidatus Omnitrophica bacterium]|nr:4-hydroxy-3-methylbut-2-enyl diphosphate reductase [Candidatus Omnitrophota bacterium]